MHQVAGAGVELPDHLACGRDPSQYVDNQGATETTPLDSHLDAKAGEYDGWLVTSADP
ncbi:hypothetical protein GCM10022254_66880 [Actinomadura meridiana]|uniref:Uncharacterized protein n=1 Tax=Actinomadura meridiana TaxID=559626 RepID=A0ABP8CLE7_9ACTN